MFPGPEYDVDGEHANVPVAPARPAARPLDAEPGQIDLWAEIGRLTQEDEAMLARRWDDVRRARRARRASERAAQRRAS